MMNKKINFIYLFLIIVLIFFIGLFIYQNNFVKAQQGGSQNILRYKSPTTTPPDAVIEPFGGTTIVGGGESVFKNEVETKGVISFPKELYSGIEPIIFHGSGAQFIGRNAYFKNDKWYYYQDGAAYGIMFGAGLESSTTTDEWAYMRFLAATPSNKDSVISFNDSFSISPYGNVKFYKNLIFNDGIALLQGNGNLNLNLNGGELVISQPFSGLSGITLKLASSSNVGGNNTPFISWHDVKGGNLYSIRSEGSYLTIGSWRYNPINNVSNYFQNVLISNSGDVVIKRHVGLLQNFNKSFYGYSYVEDITLENNLSYNNINNIINNYISSFPRIYCDKSFYIDCEEIFLFENPNNLLNTVYDYYIYIKAPAGTNININQCGNNNVACDLKAKKYNLVYYGKIVSYLELDGQDEIISNTNYSYPNNRLSCDKNENLIECPNYIFNPNISGNTNTNWADVYEVKKECYDPNNIGECLYEQYVVRFNKYKLVNNVNTIPIIFSGGNLIVEGQLFLNNGITIGNKNYFKNGLIKGSLIGPVGNASVDLHYIGKLPAGYNEERCIVFLKAFRSESCTQISPPAPAIRYCKLDSSYAEKRIGMASCWLEGDKVYGSIATDDEGDVDGEIECGYLCW